MDKFGESKPWASGEVARVVGALRQVERAGTDAACALDRLKQAVCGARE